MPDPIALDALFAAVQDHRIPIAFAILGLMFVAFAREVLPASAIATIGAAAFLALGYLNADEAIAVFSNGAAVTIAAMLVLSAALVRTGVLEALAQGMLQLGRKRPRSAILALFGVAGVASAFVNSTPIVVVLIPLAGSLATALGTSRKSLLIPLSYVAILGGTCTLIGTSTNLLVAGIARERAQMDIGIFDVTGVGLVAATIGGLFLWLAGPRLLPKSDDSSNPNEEERPDVLTQVTFGEDFAEIGRSYSELTLLKPRGVRMVSLARGAGTPDARAIDCVAEPGDRLTLRVTKRELATLGTVSGLELGTRVRTKTAETPVVQRVTLAPGSDAVGRRISEAPYLSRYRFTALGVRRKRNLAGPDFASLVHRVGDQVWLSGDAEEFTALAGDPFLAVSREPAAKPFLRGRAVAAVLTLGAVVTAAAAGVAPLPLLAIIAVGVLLLIHGMDTEDAWSAIDLDVLILIYGMLVVGQGLQNAGAVDAVVGAAEPFLATIPPAAVVAALYLLTSVLTELVTNNAVAVLLTPIALGLAQSLGIEPRALVITVMFAASASFATPIGYQTNTLVHIAGNYRFAEFLRIGVPMNVIVGAATCATIALVYL